MTDTIHINFDAKCSQCGDKGAADNGLCLKCITKNIGKGVRHSMPELKTECGHIEKFKTSTEIRDVKDDDGGVDHQLITKVSFEVAGIPDGMPMIHHALANDVVVDVLIGSHQALMNVDMVTGEIKR